MKGLRIVLSSMLMAGVVTFTSAQDTQDTTAAAENQINMENQEDFQHGIRYDQDTTARIEQQEDTASFGFDVGEQDTAAINQQQQDTTGFGFEAGAADTTAQLECPEAFSINQSLKDLKNVKGDVKLEYETEQGSYMYEREDGDVTEEFEGPEMEAMLKMDQESSDKEFQYESGTREYEFEKEDSEIEESYEGPEKEWDYEAEKEKKNKK